MIGYRVNTAKGLFFDAKPVLRSLDRATARNLSRFGSFVRQTARRSIRKRKKPAAKGQPPSSHTGALRLIFFTYEPRTESVAVGPVLLSGKQRPGRARAAELLEHGGTRAVPAAKGRPAHTQRYEPRSFMQPALEKESPKLAGLWENSLRP